VPGYPPPSGGAENHEDAVQVARLDSDAVVLDGEHPFLRLPFHGHMHPRRYLAPEFDGIPNQVLKQLRQLPESALTTGRGSEVTIAWLSPIAAVRFASACFREASASTGLKSWPFVVTLENASRSLSIAAFSLARPPQKR